MSTGNPELTWQYVYKWAEEKPGGEALVFGDERLTWAGFRDRVDRAARAFIEAGVERGGRVAMISMARNEFPITYMAANRAGAAWLGLNPKFTIDELRYQLNDARPAVLVTIREYQGLKMYKIVRKLMDEFDFLKKVLVIGEEFEGAEQFDEYCGRERPGLDAELERRDAAASPEDDALLLYTSGSTGKPKGVLHTHRSIIENTKAEVKGFYFDEGEVRALLHFPINHVAADVEIGFATIFAGGALVCIDRFDPAETLKTVERERITVFGQVPVMFLLELKQPEFFETDWSSVRRFVWAGAAAPKVMIDALTGIAARTGAMLITGYGSTEVGGFVTYTDKDDDVETLTATAGRIAPGFELKIVGGDRNELPAGEVGEIAVRGPFLMKGYLNRPDATAEAVDAEGWYYTGDLAFLDERGCIRITGRKSEMFKTGGENVFPREIEDVIESHESILFAAVIAAPDEVFQEVGWAFAMLIPGREVDEDTLKTFCKERLANFKVPKKFFIRPMLPMLQSGKINKMALKEEVVKMLEKEKQ